MRLGKVRHRFAAMLSQDEIDLGKKGPGHIKRSCKDEQMRYRYTDVCRPSNSRIRTEYALAKPDRVISSTSKETARLLGD